MAFVPPPPPNPNGYGCCHTYYKKFALIPLRSVHGTGIWLDYYYEKVTTLEGHGGPNTLNIVIFTEDECIIDKLSENR